MPRTEKGFGERSTDDIIREILREYASRENPIGKAEIIKHVKAMGYIKEKDKSKSKIERKAIEGFLDRMGRSKGPAGMRRFPRRRASAGACPEPGGPDSARLWC